MKESEKAGLQFKAEVEQQIKYHQLVQELAHRQMAVSLTTLIVLAALAVVALWIRFGG